MATNTYPYVPEEVKKAVPTLKKIATAVAFPGITAARKLKDFRTNYQENARKDIASGDVSLATLPAIATQEVKDKYLKPLIDNFSKGAVGPGTMGIKKIVDVVSNPNSESVTTNSTTPTATPTVTPKPLDQLSSSHSSVLTNRASYERAKGLPASGLPDQAGPVLLTNIGAGNENGVAIGNVEGTRKSIQGESPSRGNVNDLTAGSNKLMRITNDSGLQFEGTEGDAKKFFQPVSRGATFRERGIGPARGITEKKTTPLRELFTKENSPNMNWIERRELNKQIIANEGGIAQQNLRNIGGSGEQEIRNQGALAAANIAGDQARTKQEIENQQEQNKQAAAKKKVKLQLYKDKLGFLQKRMDSGLITPEEQTEYNKISEEYKRALSVGTTGEADKKAASYLQ